MEITQVLLKLLGLEIENDSYQNKSKYNNVEYFINILNTVCHFLFEYNNLSGHYILWYHYLHFNY